MIEHYADSIAALLGVGREYAFMLLGLFAGLCLGLIPSVWRVLAGRADLSEAGSTPEQAEAQGMARLVVNGRNIQVDQAAMADIHGLIQANQKIEAIKRLRLATGLGLAEAKAVVESLEKAMG